MFASKNWRITVYALAAIAVTVADQLVKNAVVANLQPQVSYPFIGNLVHLYLIRNNSAAFSMGFGITWIFTIISSLAALGLVWYGLRVRNSVWALLTGIATGGVLGNLIDRLFRAPGFPSGQVIDYIQIPFNFPIFNIADSAIVVVAAVVVILVGRGSKIGG